MKLVTIKTRFDKVAVEAADTDVKSNNNNNFKSLTSVKFSYHLYNYTGSVKYHTFYIKK